MAARFQYKRLLKSAKVAFKSDSMAFTKARVQLRTEFFNNRNVTNPDELKVLFQGVDEIDEVLRFHLVQGSLNDRGNYDVRLSEENMVVVDAGQSNPNGPELAPVDTSVLGESVVIDKVHKPCKSKSK